MTPEQFLKTVEEYYGVKYTPVQYKTNKKWLEVELCGQATLRSVYKILVESVKVGYNVGPSIVDFKTALQYIRSNPELVEYVPMIQDRSEPDPKILDAIGKIARAMKRGLVKDPKKMFTELTGVEIREGEE